MIDALSGRAGTCVAKGAVIGRYQSDEQVAEVARRAFTAKLKPGRMSFAGTARICDVSTSECSTWSWSG